MVFILGVLIALMVLFIIAAVTLIIVMVVINKSKSTKVNVYESKPDESDANKTYMIGSNNNVNPKQAPSVEKPVEDKNSYGSIGAIPIDPSILEQINKNETKPIEEDQDKKPIKTAPDVMVKEEEEIAPQKKETPVVEREIANDDDATVLIPKKPKAPEPVSPTPSEIKKGTYMVLTDLEDTDNVFEVPFDMPVTVGRGEWSGICISYDKKISKVHCTFRRNGDKYYIADNNSGNGTFYNDVQILDPIEIPNKAIIKIGVRGFKFEVVNK